MTIDNEQLRGCVTEKLSNKKNVSKQHLLRYGYGKKAGIKPHSSKYFFQKDFLLIFFGFLAEVALPGICNHVHGPYRFLEFGYLTRLAFVAFWS